MFTLDVPNMPPESMPVVVAAAAQGKRDRYAERVIAVCDTVSSGELPPVGSRGGYGVDPVAAGREYFWRGEKKQVSDAGVKLTLLNPPTHGQFVHEGGFDYSYAPRADYSGKDDALFLVELAGYKIKVQYYFHVIGEKYPVKGKDYAEERYNAYMEEDGDGFEWQKLLCPETGYDYYKIISDLYLPDLDVRVKVANLDGPSVGEEHGDGTTATITLDLTAAGHGWFIDATPESHEEFLPTSDSNIFLAKPGSAAEGKMDMLSVLLHEYCHALGLDHSADPRSAMAAVLQPGVRHLLSMQDLAALHGLYLPEPGEGETSKDWIPAFAGMTGEGGAPPPTPGSPGQPFLGGLAALLWRQRRSGEAVQNNHSTAVNPTLQNGTFSDSSAWSTTGSVSFSAATGTGATLTESASAQTSLRQLFVLRPGDRYLRYTVSGLSLNQTHGTASGIEFGPGDAFETALLNAKESKGPC